MGAYSSLRLALRVASLPSSIAEESCEVSDSSNDDNGNGQGELQWRESQTELGEKTLLFSFMRHVYADCCAFDIFQLKLSCCFPGAASVQHAILDDVLGQLNLLEFESWHRTTNPDCSKQGVVYKPNRKPCKPCSRNRLRKRIGRPCRMWTRGKSSCAIPTSHTRQHLHQECANDTSNDRESYAVPSSGENNSAQQCKQREVGSQSRPQSARSENQVTRSCIEPFL